MINKVLVSACLLGQKIRYNGSSLALKSQILDRWLCEGRIIPSCPERDGGMGTPRAPAEIKGTEGFDVFEGLSCVVDINGVDVTDYFVRGARTALKLCRAYDIKIAVLAEGSPSCGSNLIYNGNFEGIKKPGAGVTAALLRKNNIQVFSQYSLEEADKALCC